MQKETDTQTGKSIYYDFMRFGDSIINSTQPIEAVNSLHQSLPRYYLKYFTLRNVLTLCLCCSLHEEFNLATLDASHNKIKKLVPLSLPDSLEYVMLHENSISSIAPNTFINKLNLSRVELTSNHLQRLDLASLAISYNASNSGKK